MRCHTRRSCGPSFPTRASLGSGLAGSPHHAICHQPLDGPAACRKKNSTCCISSSKPQCFRWAWLGVSGWSNAYCDQTRGYQTRDATRSDGCKIRNVGDSHGCQNLNPRSLIGSKLIKQRGPVAATLATPDCGKNGNLAMTQGCCLSANP